MPLRSLWGRGASGEPDRSASAREAQIQVPAAPPAPTGDAGRGSPQDWLHSGVDRPTIASLLQQVIDPEIGVNIVDLGLIYGIEIDQGTANITMSLTTPGCPLSAYMEDNVEQVLWGAPGIEHVDLQIIWEPAWTPEMMSIRAKRELGWPV